MCHEENRAAALAFANELRVIVGMAPAMALLPGEPQDCKRCPIANTANKGRDGRRGRWELGGVAVLGMPAGVLKNTPRIKVPPAVTDFMEAFDVGEFPDLLAPDAVVPLEMVA